MTPCIVTRGDRQSEEENDGRDFVVSLEFVPLDQESMSSGIGFLKILVLVCCNIFQQRRKESVHFIEGN